MSPEDALPKLKEVHHIFMSLKWPDLSFSTVISYELMPIIRECKSLNDEYELRLKEWRQNLGEDRSKELIRKRALWAFGALHQFQTKHQDRLFPTIDEQRYMAFQRSMDAAFQALVSFLERSISTSGAKKIKRGRPPDPAKYREDHILWNKKSCKLPANTCLARLCEIMLAPNVRIDEKKSWVDVYRNVYQDESDSDDDWRKLDNRVRFLNSKVSKRGIPPLLRFEGGSNGYVIRLL